MGACARRWIDWHTRVYTKTKRCRQEEGWKGALEAAATDVGEAMTGDVVAMSSKSSRQGGSLQLEEVRNTCIGAM